MEKFLLKNKGILLFSLVILLQTYLFGQEYDYRLINTSFLIFEPSKSNSIPGCYACSEEKYLNGILIDSTCKGVDKTTYYLSKDLIDFGSDCFGIGPSLLGDSIIEELEGITRCFSLGSNEIVIDRTLKLGESNIFYVYENGNYFLSTIVNHDLETFLNITDSVKTFKLQLFSTNNDSIEHPANGLSFKISKTFGLVKFFGFRDFPESSINATIYSMVANSLIDSQEFSLTYKDIYDFNVDDEFHYRNENILNGPNGLEYIIKSVIKKQIGSTNNSIIYTFQHFEWGYKYNLETHEWDSYQIDTIYNRQYNDLNAYILIPDIMPNEAKIYNDGFMRLALLYKNSNKYNNRPIIRKYAIILHGSLVTQDCINLYFDSFDGAFTYFIKGCGSLFNRVSAEIAEECFPCEHLVYYKKGDEIWGEPLGNNEVELIPSHPILYPNPVTDLLIISYSKEISAVQFYAITGNLVWSDTEIHSGQYRFDMSALQKGIYIVVIKTASGDIYSEKLVVD